MVLGRVGDPQAPANGDPIDQVGRADPIERPGQVDHRLAQTVPVVVPVVVPVSVPAGAKATDVLTPVQMAIVARHARVTPVRHAVKATGATISSCQ